MKKLQMFYQCWLEVTKQTRYRDKWLSDETYFRALKAQFPTLDTIDFNRAAMNQAISRCGGNFIDDFSDSNTTGIFRRQAKGICPLTNVKRNIWGYYITTPGGLVQRPPDGMKSFLSLLQDEELNDHYSVARGVRAVVDLTNEIQGQSTTKRKAQAQADAEDEAKKPKHGPVSSKIVEETYWDSPEAKKLFLGNSSDNRDVLDVLHERIERLQQVNKTATGWKDLIEKHDKDNLCSPYDIFIIRQRCCILCLAYTYAIEEMNSAKWIEDCCLRAVLDCNRMGIGAAATNERTVAGWNVLLRVNREHFPVPDPHTHKQNKPLPNLLEYFREEITLPWTTYCVENLADLTIEMARNELITKLIPKAMAKETATNNYEEDDEQDAEARRESLLKSYLDSPISFSTAWRWLRRLGFHYDSRKKSFFVDGHERPDVVVSRNEFCTKYLANLEPRTHRWIQVTKETVENWKLEKKISCDDDDERGYAYKDEQTGEEMVEFHVDDFDMLHDVADEMGFGTFGGNLSVRKAPEEKPVMMIGQDESVYSQYHLRSKQWVGPIGQRALLPKTDGLSLMKSAFQSRETGFGLKISRIQMEEINEARRGTNYVDVDAAMAIHGQHGKKDLKESPFVVSFELGANSEGYWTYNHMAIQFEDCVDCVKVLYPQFDFVFLFDHSQGHAKKLINGLDAYSMNRGYGGAQPRMRESKIKEHDGYLGMHERTLAVGDTQSFVFQAGDVGPFWMTHQEREANRHDRLLPPPPGAPRTRNKTIAELRSDLAVLNVLNDRRRQYRLAELQQLATANNIETKIIRTHEKKGWEGQPKGLLQVLWERGWIDESQIHRYTMDLAKDEDGNVLEDAENWSLKYIMASCLDFAEELTALQHVGKELGVSVMITPKFHAELAGEGIEYSWGISKGVYRQKPLAAKRGKDSFKALVDECSSRDILTTKTVRKLSRRARAYICAYYAFYKDKERRNGGGGDDDGIAIMLHSLTLPLIERLVKAFKTHRAAIDFDAGFLNSFLPGFKAITSKQEVK